MNILHSTGMPSPTKYGSFERWLVEICKQSQKEGHTIYIAYTKDMNGVEVYSDAVHAAGAALIVLENDAQIELFCREKKIDIVHFHFDFQTHDRLYRNLSRRSIGLYVTLHCECGYYTDRSWRSNWKTCVRVWGHRLKTHWRIRYFQRIFACSHMVEQQYRIFYFWPKRKIKCLYLGIQRTEELIPERNNPIPVIACIAFHSPIKGVDILLKALKILKDSHVELRCLQIGGGSSEINGEDTKELKSLCTELGLDDVVMWVGLTNNVYQYLSSADIYCQPSRTEAICLSIAEAMDSSLPVVASNVGGISELVKDGVNGFLIEPDNPEILADKLELLLCDPKLRQFMGSCSRKRLDEMVFSQKNSAEELLRLYRDNHIKILR